MPESWSPVEPAPSSSPAPPVYAGGPHRIEVYNSNDQFDSTGNLNPGGGTGGGIKPGKHPDLK